MSSRFTFLEEERMDLELWILLRLLIAAALSGLIGYERERGASRPGCTICLPRSGRRCLCHLRIVLGVQLLALPPGRHPRADRPLATVRQS
jgi:hypothetical protein